jgi:hypothetical protein
VIRSCLRNDALENRGRLGISSQPPIYFRQAEIDKQKLFLLIAILKDRWIGICAANAPVAA